jgi:glycosyltransferase involved in cell wall biosynthesis
VKEFIDAAKIVRQQNPATQFWLIGEIDRENPSSIHHQDLMKWIRDPNIHYHGATENIRKYIERSDCIVLPSYREGMPRVIMESMAMERAVITTDTAGCRETVDDTINGFLVPVKDPGMLAKAMVKFAELTRDQQTQMGKAGRKKVLDEFDDKIIATHLVDAILPWLK